MENRNTVGLQIYRRLRYWVSTGFLSTVIGSSRLNAFEGCGLAPEVGGSLALRYKLHWLRSMYVTEEEDSAASQQLDESLRDYCHRRSIPESSERPLDEYDWRRGSPADFVARFVERNPRPVVLRGLLADTPSVKNWTVDYFVDRYPDADMQFIDGSRGRLAETREGKYAHNAETLFGEHPELEKALGLEAIMPYGGQLDYKYSQMFLGYKQTGSPLHCANTWNFFVMINGRKRWTLIDPAHSYFVHARMTKDMVYAVSHSLTFPAHVADQHFLFRYCPRFTVTLEPGDVLLNPPWWWHAVENVTSSSIGVSSRWSSRLMSEPTNRYFLLLQMLNRRFWSLESTFLQPVEKGSAEGARKTRERATH